MDFVAIIPARYESSRFPGKPLAILGNKPMIQLVVENISKALDHVWVATDDARIFDAVKNFGGNAVMTSKEHQSGTDRCAEAARILAREIHFDVVVNVQGDEPFIQPEQIECLKSCFSDNTEIATLIKKIETSDELFNPNRPKVVVDDFFNALYFSRSPVPYLRGEEEQKWHVLFKYWAHIGMYAYKADVLQKITILSQGKLEKAESLEQLRWLENGFKIKVAETAHQSIGIDTPEDLQTALSFLNSTKR
ncbi:3-deoxy-manno-octulosonate cytidylyltransferase [Maribellus comscasis]|uniref:3-deoxy-manno-octulosonate cytidylyltransferase n=1 Tax=Maribellus comscasis TaxID=2681766 RepID=A0A6I6JKP9_9BACT|nr:3-deoxy-manno-octulosonate cytidylyltransferase [Maribellus comscasis]QGY43425.1 3-deoxy-manno-octulosonate cytidylyltransferase [Maribellus comscasis]